MRKLALADFGGGIWDDLDAPAGYVYDAVEAVVDGTDLVQRGGTAYRGSESGANRLGLAAADLAGGVRVVVWDLTGISVLSDDGTSLDAVAVSVGSDQVVPFSRAVVHAGAMVLRKYGEPGLWLYGGSRLADYTETGGVAVNKGSRLLAGGAGWLTNVAAGALVSLAGGPRVVDRVDSNTQATMRTVHTGANNAYISFDFHQALEYEPAQPSTEKVGNGPFSCMAVAGNRLLLADGSKVWESIPSAFAFNENEFWDFGSTVRGMESLGASEALVFTETGAWTIENIALDLTDAAGNLQQQQRLLSPNLVLWGDSGIAAWDGRVVVPALDGVYLFTPGEAPVPVGRGIRNRYRRYVAGEFRPGVATVFAGHYFLPILTSAGLEVEVLVCRLDQPGRSGLRPAWTRWATGGVPAAVVREPVEDGTVRLTGLVHDGAENDRLLDLSGCLSPSAVSTDAGGGVVHLDVTTNDLATGPGNRNTVLRLRARYALSGSGVSVIPSLIVGPESGYTETDLTAGSTADGESGTPWRFAKRTERLRVRVRSSGAAAKLRLRTLELFVRESNRP